MSITITVVGSFKLNIKFFEREKKTISNKCGRVNNAIKSINFRFFSLFIDCKSIRCDDLCFKYGAILLFVFCPLVDEDLVHVTHAVSKYFMGQIKLFAQSLY